MAKEYIDRKVLLSEFDNYEPDEWFEAEHELWLDLRLETIQSPAADVVSIETIKAWLWKIAMNNVCVPVEGDWSSVCEEIISRLDGLRAFAKEMDGERRNQAAEKQGS